MHTFLIRVPCFLFLRACVLRLFRFYRVNKLDVKMVNYHGLGCHGYTPKCSYVITASFPVQVAMKFVKRSSVLEFIKVKYPFKTAKYSFP